MSDSKIKADKIYTKEDFSEIGMVRQIKFGKLLLTVECFWNDGSSPTPVAWRVLKTAKIPNDEEIE